MTRQTLPHRGSGGFGGSRVIGIRTSLGREPPTSGRSTILGRDYRALPNPARHVGVGIMAATAEWSQRTGLVTVTLEPRRGRVFGAKIVAAVVLGLVVVAAAFAASAIAEGLAIAVRGAPADWSVPGSTLWGFLLAMTLFIVQGLGFGSHCPVLRPAWERPGQPGRFSPAGTEVVGPGW